MPAIYTLAADLSPADKRSAVMGRIGAMIGLAAIVGPMYSGIVRQGGRAYGGLQFGPGGDADRCTADLDLAGNAEPCARREGRAEPHR